MVLKGDFTPHISASCRVQLLVFGLGVAVFPVGFVFVDYLPLLFHGFVIKMENKSFEATPESFSGLCGVFIGAPQL
jgi:hypothetical protein